MSNKQRMAQLVKYLHNLAGAIGKDLYTLLDGEIELAPFDFKPYLLPWKAKLLARYLYFFAVLKRLVELQEHVLSPGLLGRPSFSGEQIKKLATHLAIRPSGEIKRLASYSDEDIERIVSSSSHSVEETWRELHKHLSFFSEDQLEQLNKELSPKFSESKISFFIEDLADLCSRRVDLPSKVHVADYRDEIRMIQKRLKATLRDLRRIIDNRLDLAPSFTLDDIRSGNLVTELQETMNVTSLASKALEPLQELLNSLNEVEHILEARKPPPYRGRADAEGFVKNIARLFSKFLGEPTTYEGGPFFNVVIIALDAVGLPATDPSRAIRAAVKSLKTS